MDYEERYLNLLDKIQANTDAVRAQLANHETRITVLETAKRDDWKASLLMLLAKAVVIGAVVIASLAGAGGLLKSVLGL